MTRITLDVPTGNADEFVKAIQGSARGGNPFVPAGTAVVVGQHEAIVHGSDDHPFITTRTSKGEYDVFLKSGRVQVYLADGRSYELDVNGLIDAYGDNTGEADYESCIGRIG